MSSEDLEKYDEFDDLSLNTEDDSRSDLDEYGVWIKKKTDDLASVQGDKNAVEETSSDNDEDKDEMEGEPFNFDGAEEEVSMQDDSTEKLSSQDDSSSFDDIDMSDFFTDFENDDTAETAAKEDEVALNMDLNFDNMDSFAEEDGGDDFDAMLSEAEGNEISSGGSDSLEDVEIDDLLSDSTPVASSSNMQNEQKLEDISINVNVDESQSLSNLPNDEENVSLDIAKPSIEDAHEAEEKVGEEKIVIKNTVVEPENIGEIVEKNKQVLGETVDSKEKTHVSDAHFNDVEAVARDLAQGEVCQKSSIPAVVQVEGIDRLELLLQSVIQELRSIKEEIANLKYEVPDTAQVAKEKAEDEALRVQDTAEDSGFFKDEDTDEAIALTGDELNNILITADFTEESGNGVEFDQNESLLAKDEVDGEATETFEDKGEVALDNHETEEDIQAGEDSLETCGEDEKNIDEDVEFTNDKDFDFDEIELDNPKLDDFVIPEELDYNMLNVESEGTSTGEVGEERVEKTEGADMSYLDETDDEDVAEQSEDVDSSFLPSTQEINTASIDDDSSSIEEGDLSSDSLAEDSSSLADEGGVLSDSALEPDDRSESEELPSIVKKDVKSVLSYMDQLFDSLPEEKLKEFAESEYFEMYKKLFKELGL